MIASSQQPRLPPLWTAVILRRRTSAGWFRALAMQSGSSLLQWLEDLWLISPIWDNAKVTMNNHKKVCYYAKPSWKDLSMHKGILNPNSSPLVKRIVCTTKTFSALSKTGLWFVEGGDVWRELLSGVPRNDYLGALIWVKSYCFGYMYLKNKESRGDLQQWPVQSSDWNPDKGIYCFHKNTLSLLEK